MGENVTELNVGSFDSSIAKGKWIVDFWAEWCGPCKIMAPHFEKAAAELKGKVNFGKVNVEENYDLSEKLKIMSIPTTILFKDGEVQHVTVGAMNKDQIKNLVEEML